MDVKRLKRETRRVLRSYVNHALPVFLLMCLVVLTLAPVYSQTLRQARRVVTEGLAADLDASFQLVSRQMNTLRVLVSIFRQNESTRSISLQTDEQLREDRYVTLYNLKKDAGTLGQYDLLGQKIIVQFRRNDSILCDQTVYHDKRTAYGLGLCYENMTYEQWQDRLFNHVSFSWPVERARLGIGDEMREYITVNAYFSYSLSTTVVVSTLFPLDTLRETLLPAQAREECLLYLTDVHEGALYDSLGGEGQCLLENEEGGTLHIGGKEYLTFSCSSSELGFSVAIGVPAYVLYTGVEPVIRTINGILLLTLLCGMLYCAVYAYVSFRPMLRIMNALGGLDEGQGSFYARLQREVERLNSDRTLLRDRQEEILRQMDGFALDRALSGLRLTETEQERLEQRETLRGAYQAVQIACDGDGPEDCQRFLIRARMLLEASFSPCEISLRDRLILILPADGEETRKRLEILFDTLFRTADKPIFMAVSAAHRGTGELALAARETDQALYRSRLAVRSSIACYDESMQETRSPLIALQKYVNLTAGLVRGDMTAVRESMEEFRCLLKGEDLEPEWIARVLGNLREAVDEAAAGLGEEAVRWDDCARMPPLLQVNWMEQCMLGLCERAARQREGSLDERVRQILEFIERGYCDSSFCLSTVAEEFKLSEKYVSRFIKEQTGQNFSAHVEQKRMQRARALLEQTDWTVDEIARRTGYEYLNTFYKAFKRHFGCAPNDFKRPGSPKA